MIYSHTAIAVLAAAVAATCTWQVQEWRFNSKESDRAKETLAHVQHSAATAIRRQDNVIQAQNEAATRMVRLRRDADNARDGLTRLQHASSEALLRAKASLDACNAVTAAYSAILAESSDFIQEVAREADGCFSDQQLLNNAWPK